MITRRRFLTTLAAGAAAVLGASCSSGTDALDEPAPPSEGMPQATAVSSTGSSAEPSITPTAGLPAASLDEKIGQMIMMGFRGFSVTPGQGVFADIAAGRVGNVVLFDYDLASGTPARNIQSPDQLAKLTRDLQALSPRWPLLISTDQEGGIVSRLKPSNGFPATLSAQELGSLNNPDVTRNEAEKMATTLAAHGVNHNLAPVVDVNVNRNNPVIGGLERSFSSDSAVVAQQAAAFIEGHHKQDVLTTLKHFPGHGSSRADSHLGFVDVTDTWTEAELVPYREIIRAGNADTVMTAHIFNAKLDPQFPATLSKPTITGILREQLGFEGVVVTDDMMMGAIANYYRFEDALVVAVDAGADIVAVSNNTTTHEPDVSARTFNALRNAVNSGRITEARVDESYRRIMALKDRLS